MLKEIAQSDSSDEIVQRSKLTVETFEEEGDSAVKREYTFTHGDEWDQWNFSEYTEYWSEERIPREWKMRKHMFWHEDDAISFQTPQPVVEQLQDLLSTETFK